MQAHLHRDAFLERLRQEEIWDVIVIGGGATGLGIALDAAARGFRTVLFEQHDFGKGTSSRSTKLIHGGVRYLREGDISLVREALRERGLLRHNAPHLVWPRLFVVPCYRWWERPFYGLGLWIYDRLAGPARMGPMCWLDATETRALLPTLQTDHLRGGLAYTDGQFDDARFLVHLAWTAAEHGAVVLNYMPVEALLRTRTRLEGVIARDLESGEQFEVRGRVVVNATGVFADAVRRMDNPEAAPLIIPSQGVHLVLPRRFLPGEAALLVPRTDDGRVLFVIPWHGHVLLGTTDAPVPTPALEPLPTSEEIAYLLAHAARYLQPAPTNADIRAVFAGLRPLVQRSPLKEDTAHLSREHVIVVSRRGLVTITGGKWTTYRLMAAETVDRALQVAGLPHRPSPTATLRLHGSTWQIDLSDPWHVYGSDAGRIRQLMKTDPELATPLHPRLPYRMVEVVWAVRYEMARTLEDVLARRTRALFLDAEAACQAAPAVAQRIAAELGRDATWVQEQCRHFMALTHRYSSVLPEPAN
ncbi:glycerol-3-phosphate dehydrogenase/oxidase [Rhodothermus profundi]|uniref:Glycerol-3-phosphate dehydrogenase n=1 Tax=Rhodothermus profundi TaxID=633813 RepID=A0A1M6TIP8_9BACT|nr:glycerol-3-phosphate dehydrogenase/oxidase [Rhodothermus profundi]SHK56804.1 glycerol-3-phosphate dehydrogenase [Rhodothermus profundi]